MAKYTALGAILKRYRLAAGLSQETLAVRANLSTRAVSDLERGLHRRPHPHTLDSLASALALPPGQRALLLAAALPARDDPDAANGLPALPRPWRVPEPPVAIIGRHAERARAHGLLQDGGARLLTITGPGGAGKTRLALEIARELAENTRGGFADGAVFVPLASLSDAALVPWTVGQAVGLREQPGMPVVERVYALLGDRHGLFVLDNFEHLLDAAGFVAELLARCPRLSLLVTSRTPLRLRAERVLPLAPLPLRDAVSLFQQRALAVRPDGAFATDDIAGLCRQLDCLPLALELAAAQARLLSLDQILGRMTDRLALLRGGARDLPARQQTMEDAIAWSYDLLTEPQRRCFRALGVFAGTWSLAAAEAVCWDEGEIPSHEALLTLADVVDASLVQTEVVAGGAVRFSLLEVVREYALARLDEAGEKELCQRRHAVYFARLADDVADAGFGEHITTMPLALELPNARLALTWAEAHGEAALGLRLAGFARLWHVLGATGEAVRWQERMLTLETATRDPAHPTALLGLRALRLSGLARALLGYGDLARAGVCAAEAVACARATGGDATISDAFASAGMVAQAAGVLAAAEPAFAESYTYARKSGSATLIYRAQFQLAGIALAQGDEERAGVLYGEALAGAHSCRSAWDAAMITTMLGHLARQQQRYAVAFAYYRESLEALRTFHTPSFTAWCMEGVAATLAAEGRFSRAVPLAAAAATMRAQANAPLPPVERKEVEEMLSMARSTLGEPAFRARWLRGAEMEMDAAIASALAATATSDASCAPARPHRTGTRRA